MLMGRLRHRDAVRRVVDFDENIIAEGRIGERRSARLDDQAVGMQVGEVHRQVGAAGIRRVRHLDGIKQRKLVHQADLELVTGLQREPGAAVVGDGARPCRARIPDRHGALADLVHPARGI